MELLAFQTGIKMVHVPDKGAGPAVQDVIGGHVPIMTPDVATARQPINAGLLKAIAASAPVAEFPDLPIFEQFGVTGFEPPTWIGLAARPAPRSRSSTSSTGNRRDPAHRGDAPEDQQCRRHRHGRHAAAFRRLHEGRGSQWKVLLEAANITVQ